MKTETSSESPAERSGSDIAPGLPGLFRVASAPNKTLVKGNRSRAASALRSIRAKSSGLRIASQDDPPTRVTDRSRQRPAVREVKGVRRLFGPRRTPSAGLPVLPSMSVTRTDTPPTVTIIAPPSYRAGTGPSRRPPGIPSATRRGSPTGQRRPPCRTPDRSPP